MSAKSIVCLRCGKHLKFGTEVCKYCGFSFKNVLEKEQDRDDQLSKVREELKSALRTGDKLKAYSCLGKLELLNDPKLHLHNMEVLLHDSEYELAENELTLHLSTFLNLKNTDDLSFSEEEIEVLPYDLELNARSGRLILFTIHNGGSGEVALDMYQRLHLSQIALDNAPIWELKLYFELKDIEDQDDGVRVIKNYTKSNNEYRLLFWQHFCDDIVNFIEYRRKIYFTENRYSEVGESFDLSEDEVLTFRKYAQLLVIRPIMDEFGNNPVERIFNANYEEIVSEEFIKWIDSFLEAILFGEVNPFPDDPTNYFTYFKCIEKLNAMKIYCKSANMYLDKLLSLKEYFPDEVRHIIGTAYFERHSRGLKIKDSMNSYIKDNMTAVTNEMEDEKNRRIYSILSPKGKSAMELAEWEFKNSVIKDYGWRDAGLISLSFFRIVELELNKSFPICRTIQ